MEIIIIIILSGLFGLIMYKKINKAKDGDSCCK